MSAIPALGRRTFILDAYDINRRLLSSRRVTTTAPGITTPITFDSGSFDIAYFALYDNSGGINEPVGMDNLSFNTGGAPPAVSLLLSGYVLLSQGQTAQYNVSLFRHNGSNGNVSLDLAGLPAGAHGSFNPSTVTGTNTTSTLTLSVDDNAPLSLGKFTIIATPGAGAGTVVQQVAASIQVVQPFATYVGVDSHQPSEDTLARSPRVVPLD